jgi:uncharacterized Tic20 family protein
MKKQIIPEVKETSNEKTGFALSKTNWILMGVSVALIVFGFLLMTGGASGEKFNPDIFSTRRITVGPMISLFGFLFMIVAIMWPSEKEE